MKKLISSVLVLFIVFTFFAGCSKTPNQDEESTTNSSQIKHTVVIDCNNFSDDFNEEEFYETLSGIEGIFYTKNSETNEYVLKMTDVAYKNLKELKSKDVISGFDEIINDTENYVTDIKYDDDFRTLSVFVDREKMPEVLSDYDNTLISVMVYPMAYQIYTVEGQSVTINVIYADNNETLKIVSYPVVIE